MRLWLLLLLCCLWPSISEATTLTAATCEEADIQAKITLAVDGDTVQIPAGTCHWNTQVYIPNTKGITLQGAGEGVTTIINDGAGTWTTYNGFAGMLMVAVSPGHSVSRVTALTINGASSTFASTYEIFIYGHALDSFRIDHLSCINLTNTRCIATLTDNNAFAELSGLVDHVTCIATSSGNTQCFNNQVATGSAKAGAWKFPTLLGSNHATYWEDITCTFVGSTFDSCFDNYSGQSYVMRFSTISHVNVGNHGADSDIRGSHHLESYRNTWRSDGGTINANLWRSGPNIIFDETYTNVGGGSVVDAIIIALYRSDPNCLTQSGCGLPAHACDGTSAYDGNFGGSGAPGYPCLDQIGWFWPPPAGCATEAACEAPNGTNAVYAPAYMWNNLKNGVAAAPTTLFYNPDFLHTNSATAPFRIDAYSDVGASCTGGGACTVGIGMGTTMPTSCTTGVGFWKTNEGNWNQAVGTPGGQGVLYKCTATNTWTLSYTPYTYPHPLQASSVSPPSAPTGLTIQ